MALLRLRALPLAAAFVVLGLFASACTVASASDSSPAPSPAPAAPTDSASPIVAAVGDLVCAFGAATPRSPAKIEEVGKCKPGAVAKLVNTGNYDAFFPLGDLQYSYGGYWRYLRYWNRYYGEVKSITRPVPGNHEGYNGLFLGYYRYFGKQAHPPGGYYSFDLGTWHVLALNSQMCRGKVWGVRTHVHSSRTVTGHTRWQQIPGGGCEPGDRMYRWAQHDLAAHADATCTLAMYHHPFYRLGATLFNPKGDVAPLFKLMADQGVDVVLNGHEHNYARFDPMDAAGNADPEGTTEFIVGTGGDSYVPVPKTLPDNVASANAGTYGILQLTLDPGGYAWAFEPIPGDPPFSDEGSADCH